MFFQENLCLSQESYTAHAEKKQKNRPGVCVCVDLCYQELLQDYNISSLQGRRALYGYSAQRSYAIERGID